MPIRIQKEDFDLSEEMAKLRAGKNQVGASVVFTGLVRETGKEGDISEMWLEHYPGMTEKVLEGLVKEARARWDITEALIIHRIGALKPTDQIVLVAALSPHRKEAFLACEFIMNALKTNAPFWKREKDDTGTHWLTPLEPSPLSNI